MTRRIYWPVLLLAVAALAACGSGAVPISEATSAPAQAASLTDPGYSRTPDGYYVRGRADAPVVIEDYSDFL